MPQKLAGKVAIVTGASKGIGAAIAKQLAAAGAAVVVNYSSGKEGADRVVKEITGAGGKAIAVKANFAKPEEIKSLFDETKKAFNRLDILVNNAGIYETSALAEITPEHFHKQFNINVLGLMLATQEAAKLIGPEGGSIINISSVVSTSGFPNYGVYAATKGAVDSATRVFAAELGPRKIRVNAINPGMVDTEGFRTAGLAESEFRKGYEAQAPLRRIGKPDDIASVAVFLASSDSGWMTGEMLYVSGGVH